MAAESKKKKKKLFFIINPTSGAANLDLAMLITNYFEKRPEEIELFKLPKNCSLAKIKAAADKAKADKVIAVGGDGTLKLVAECLLNTDLPIGILPTGSANGMAKELGIPMDLHKALAKIVKGKSKLIHAVLINEQLCVHLADLGFNAFLVKKFNELHDRGMWTYAKAAWHAFWNHRKMDVEFKIGNKLIKEKAAMVAIANATKYGTGLQINPQGKLNDNLFEIILVKKYAVMEIIKIWISKLPWNPKKIEIFQTKEINITTKHKAHFQVDGEYLGKVNRISAKLLPKAIRVIV